MTASPAERSTAGRFSLTAMAVAAALAAVDAGAQTRAPTPLTPQVLTPSTAPRTQPGPAEPGPPPIADIPAPPPPIVARVEVQTLQAIDPNSVGVLRSADGGLGVDMWMGTSLGLVQRLMPHLPAATPSRAARALTRRLLLSEAAAPKGEPWGDKSLLQLRIERLAATGDVDGTLALLEAIPAPAMSRPLQRAQIEALLLAGKETQACEEAGRLQDDGDDPLLAKIQVFCQIRAGRTADAQLGLAMLRETGQVDPSFFALAEDLLGIPSPGPATLPAPTPLLLAMVHASGKPMPQDVAASGHPAVLRAVAERAEANPDLRLIAAEKAEQIGALEAGKLADLYAAVAFSDADKGRPAAEVATEATARSRAFLYQAAISQATPAAQANTIELALSEARMRGEYFSAARLYAPLIAAVAPAPELSSFAETALRGLLAAGDVVTATRWLPVTEPQGAVAILARLAGLPDTGPLTPAALTAWRSGLQGLPPTQAERRMAITFGLLSALGDTVPAEAWVPLMGGPPLTSATVPQPALWHALPAAATAGRRAETALLALVSLGEGGPGATEPTTLYRVVAALAAAGLEAEARALAVEAAIANGV